MKKIYCFDDVYVKNLSKIVLARMKLEERINKKLIKRYNLPLSFHDIKLIDDILNNENSHFVETFKEYLIYDDPNEFLRKMYHKKEIQKKLPKILKFYEKYSKIYANYTVIPEHKYMYKNIRRKQKVIDQMQDKSYENSDEETNEEKDFFDSHILNTEVMDSINSFTMSLNYNTSNNNTSKSDLSINKLLIKINESEKQSEIFKKFKKNINYDDSRNFIRIKKKKIINNKGFNNNIIYSLLTNSKSNNNEKLNKNSLNKISDSIKLEKTILSNNTSPKFITKKILSSPKIIKKKINSLSPITSMNHSGKNLIIQKLVSHSKSNKQIERISQNNFHSKIFSYKYKNLYKGLDLNVNKKSKNNIYNNKVLSNNIYNNKELLKNVFLNSGSVFNTPKSQYTNSNISLNNNLKQNSIQKSITKNNSMKFDLNLRKIFFNNFPDSKSSSTDRKTIKTIFYERMGKYFNKNYKNNSSSKINKISVEDNKKIFKTIKISLKNKDNNKNINQRIKRPNQSRVLSPNNSNSLSINFRRIPSLHVNLGEKFKIKNFEKINIITKNNENFLLHSERLKKNNILLNK